MTAAAAPRVGDTLTTAEQLDALPDGVIVMLPTSKVPAVRFEDVWFVPGFEEGQPSSGLRLPTTVLYVPGEQPGPSTDQALAEAWAEGHRTGWEHCQDGNYGNDHWDDPTPNPYAAAGRAETTTATNEDVRAEVDRLLLRHGHVEWTEHDARTVGEVLDSAGLLATGRTRPTRDDLARAIASGYETDHPTPNRHDYRAADAVLALLRGGA